MAPVAPRDRGLGGRPVCPIRWRFSDQLTDIQGDARVPDYPTTGPTAGWYTDPANPGQERWWGGVEWTHDTRPLQPVVAAPVIANVPGGGVNPFAGRLPEQTGIGSGLSGPSFSTGTNDFSAFNAVGTSPFTSQQPSFAVAPSWNSTSAPVHSEEPRNGIATAGLIFSIFGFSLVGIILSALGLKKARQLQAEGDAPVGRKRSRWGLGLGIASIIISIALAVAYFLAWNQIYAFILEQTSQATSISETDDAAELPTAPVENDGTYDRVSYEQAIVAEYAADGLPTPDSVSCPETGSTAAGGVIVCEIISGDVTETRTAEYFEDGGYSISTTSFSG